MTSVLTADGLKAWPLAGSAVQGTAFPRRMGIDLIGLNKSLSYDNLYKQQPWVYAAVNKLARGIARLPWQAFDSPEATAAHLLPESDPLSALLARPYPRGSGFKLREHMVASMVLYGASITIKDRPGPGRPPTNLWPIPWRYVEVIQGSQRPIDAYVITVGSERRYFVPEDVIHCQWWSPDGLGISPLEPLRVTLALEDAAQRYSVSSFANGARPSGAVTTEQPMPKPAREELRTEIESMHAGMDNAFRIALLTHGLKWEPFAHSAQEAELIPLRKLTRDEVCGVLDIPPPALHILDRATFSNIDEQHRMLYQDSYGPYLTNIEETMAVELIEMDFPGKAMAFDMDEMLRGDPEKRSQSQQRRFQSGAVTPNELRAEEGKDPAPGSFNGDQIVPDHPANQVYIPVNMTPVSAVSTDKPEPVVPAAPPAPPSQEQRTLAAILQELENLKAAAVGNGNGH